MELYNKVRNDMVDTYPYNATGKTVAGYKHKELDYNMQIVWQTAKKNNVVRGNLIDI